MSDETVSLFLLIEIDIEYWMGRALTHLEAGNLIEAKKDIACADNAMHNLWEKL